MIIFRNLDDIRDKLANAVVTIGNFDGVHLGHRAIFRRVREAAAELGGVSVAITFVPHPLRLLPSRKSLRLITPYGEKEGLIAASGIDYLVIIPFTGEFAAMSAPDFVSRVLVGRIGMKKLVIGYDYAFGRNREGNVALLQKLGGELGFDVEVLAPIGNGDNVYSSTRVREMIGAGEVKGVVSLLGRHFFLDGTVVHGHHRGKGLGFPTANLATENELIPKSGVYAVKVKIDDVLYDGACNIGANPTFGDEAISIEVFIFDYAGDLYGRRLRLLFVDRIRDEMKFPDAAALQQAIRADVARCREILRGATVIEYHEQPGKSDSADN
ncbi:MAG: bifunctional riboflavin kinase/FAD synthetase [Geobacteraceae bacterium]|nr:bifunctional riboflavin kinase/FAD synthetase [Geobacteraceae bacterium]